MDQSLDAHSLLCICSKLKASEILTTGSTCTTLASVTRANSLWQPLLQRDFGLYVQASGSGVDLQSTYKQLATSPGSYALRFAAVYTDGGCDGMPDDLTYWADHAFQPNYYSPHCSDGKQDINILAVLQPHGCDVDVQLAQHRQFLVERCAPAAALLFGPPGVAAVHPSQSIPQAAASLAGWSSVGLERLFMDLYQDLVLHQQQSTWGKLLLHDVAAHQVPQQLQRLDAAAQRIEARQGRGLYTTVQQVPQDAVVAAAKAAAAACSASDVYRLPRHSSCTDICSQSAIDDMVLSEVARASSFDMPPLPAAAVQQQSAAGTSAVAQLAAANSNSTVTATNLSGGSNIAAAAAAASCEEMTPKQAARHMYDRKQLQWFSEQSSTNVTALVKEVIISRVGHFTCPLAAGALLLGQHPASAAAAAAVQHSTSSHSNDTDDGAQLQQALAVKHDPLVTVLNGVTSLEQVQAAVAAGRLPPARSYGVTPGAQWIEFMPLSEHQREVRAKQGWYLRPVIWFKFSTPPPAPPPATQPPAAAVVDAAGQPVHNLQDHADEAEVHEEDLASETDAAAAAAAAGAVGAEADAAVEQQGPVVLEASSQEAAQPGGSVGSMETSSADEETSPHLAPTGSFTQAGALVEDSVSSADEDDFTSPSSAGDEDMQEDTDAAAAGAAAVGTSDDEVFLDATDVDLMDDQPTSAAPLPKQQLPLVQQQNQQRHSQQQLQLGSSSVEQVQQRRPHWRGSGKPAVTVCPPPDGLQELMPNDASVPSHLLLRLPLSAVHSGNIAVLKLISSENKMDEYDDPAEEPNIDVQCISLRGVAVEVTAAGASLL